MNACAMLEQCGRHQRGELPRLPEGVEAYVAGGPCLAEEPMGAPDARPLPPECWG